jgi:hypothetical protein
MPRSSSAVNLAAALANAASSSAVHSANVVWPVRSILISLPIATSSA